MDLPSNNHPFPPLVAIRGLMLPKTSSTGTRLPLLVSIQGLTASAVHELPKEPQEIDVGQLIQAANTRAQDESLEHQKLLEDLDEAQRMLEELETSSQWHESKIREMDDDIRDEMQHHKSLKLDLARTLEQVKQQREVLQDLRTEVTDLEVLRAELSILRDMNAELRKDAQDLRERNADCISKRSELLISMNKVERLSREALQEKDSEIDGLESQVAASEENLKRVKAEEETLRKHINTLDTKIANLRLHLAQAEKDVATLQIDNRDLRDENTEITNLRSQLSASESKAEQAERDIEALKLENSNLCDSNSKLRNNDTKITNLKSELATLNSDVDRLKSEAEALRIENDKLRDNDAEITNLKSELATSNSDVDRLKSEAAALQIENDKLRDADTEILALKSRLATSDGKVDQLAGEAKTLHDENEKLRNEITEVSELKSKLATSDGKVDQLAGEAKTLRDENEKLRNDVTEVSQLKSQLAASSASEIERLKGEAETLRDENESLRNEITEVSELKSQLAASLDSEIERLKGEAATLGEKNDKLRDEHDKVCQENEQHLETGLMAVEECKRLEAQLKEVSASKRLYLEQYLSLRGSIRAVCRIRRNPDPSDNPEGIRLQISNDTDGASLEVYRKGKSSLADVRARPPQENKKSWRLDQIFSPTDDNNTIWEEVGTLLESAVDGAQVVVILYGRTGTGKSFTSEGIWSRLGEFLFPDSDDSSSGNKDLGAREESTSSGDSSSDEDDGDLREEQVRLWSTEIYCGELRDLLAMKQKNGAAQDGNLPLPGSNGMLDPVRHCGATSIVMSDRQCLEAALGQVAKARKSSQTRANEKSSRSHSFTCVELPGGGSITLVDLAGHERDSVGSSQAELQAINKSLSALTHALGKLVSSTHKPDRASRGEAGQQANPKKAGEDKKIKVTPPRAKGTPPNKKAMPDKRTTTTGIGSVWASPELLPRIVGGLMCRGSGSQHGGIRLESKVMFLATLDFVTLDSTLGSEHTLAELQNSGLITGN